MALAEALSDAALKFAMNAEGDTWPTPVAGRIRSSDAGSRPVAPSGASSGLPASRMIRSPCGCVISMQLPPICWVPRWTVRVRVKDSPVAGAAVARRLGPTTPALRRLGPVEDARQAIPRTAPPKRPRTADERSYLQPQGSLADQLLRSPAAATRWRLDTSPGPGCPPPRPGGTSGGKSREVTFALRSARRWPVALRLAQRRRTRKTQGESKQDGPLADAKALQSRSLALVSLPRNVMRGGFYRSEALILSVSARERATLQILAVRLEPTPHHFGGRLIAARFAVFGLQLGLMADTRRDLGSRHRRSLERRREAWPARPIRWGQSGDMR
jgi:hypothetical protein